MTDYGVTEFVDEGTFYVRQPHCAVTVRVRDVLAERKVYDRLWLVEVGNGDHWEEVFSFSNEEQARAAQEKFALFINETAGDDV